MGDRKASPPQSAFEQHGLKKTLGLLLDEISQLYLADQIPWVVGYSGGKDSTAVLQLVWMALSRLKSEERSKPVHVISTDTLVENPVVAAWVTNSLKAIDADREGSESADFVTPANANRSGFVLG